MKSPIRVGDALENGGEVTGGSSTIMFMGRPVARKGDPALCARHGPTTIVEGEERYPDQDGNPVAMHHHCCECGCRLISSLQNVHFG
ncbi:PAAR domain-containing protein [Cupriavidus necator]|uniref:PAAR n=1 Tax=Cupriavidus pinatubonensis (strain JMP 134 / LMG 1197) TaxID=264198 RepID=Q477N5_CUPPJ|nr:PAAR domain-containing protein [Cupriavidus necator]